MTDETKANEDRIDKALMERLREGDDLALQELMARWKHSLVSFLYRYTGNWSVAVELGQETFVRVYQSRARYQPKGSFSTWIFTIASNLAKNEARWRRRHPGSVFAQQEIVEETGGEALADVAAGEATPDQWMEREERWEEVRQAIGQLPMALRTVILLFEYEGLSQREIGEVLQCSAKAVETRLYRAKALLREKLKNVT